MTKSKKTEQAVGNLTKTGLAAELANRMGVAQAIADEAVENIFDICAQRVAQGHSVSITNFGTFARVVRKARQARNPQTGDVLTAPERKAVRFIVSPRLAQYTNSEMPEKATIRKRSKGPSRV